MIESEVVLGTTVTDMITGLNGILTIKSIRMNGNVQFCITPKGDGKTIPDSYYVDAHSLELDKEQFPIPCTEAKIDTNLVLGGKAEDVTTGTIGVLIDMHIHLNGCVGYHLAYKDKDENPRTHYVDQNKLVMRVIPAVIPPKNAINNGNRAGGPSVKMNRNQMRG